MAKIPKLTDEEVEQQLANIERARRHANEALARLEEQRRRATERDEPAQK